MILLDTNVVSAVMARKPEPNVIRWMDLQPTEDLSLSAVTVAEVRFGLAILPDGQRRRDLEQRFDRFLARGFAHRILPFDREAARLYGDLMARRRRLGRPMSALDGQIAAIARTYDAALATRNRRDFEECDLELIDPFAVPSEDPDASRSRLESGT